MQTVTDDPPRPASRPAEIDVEIVIPVYNEERTLAATIHRLHRFMSRRLPLSWQITIADNASTDCTPEIAKALAATLDGVEVLRLEQKGRGRALRAAWSASTARVVAYMDVDLSTDLRALLPLLAPLLSGHSQVAIGSRLAPGSRVSRGVKRELISRAYNLILRTVLRAKFSDAQCGFKAVRSDVLHGLLGSVRDESWFFDTELLVLAQRRGMRIHEVPVDWVDDPDSRVDIVSTAMEDLRGVARLALAAPITRFLGIGLASTVAYALLFLVLAGALGSVLASAVALATTAVANTAANRRLTFGIRGRERLGRQHLAGVIVFAGRRSLQSSRLITVWASVPASHRHPVFARLYPRISRGAEQTGGAEHRRKLLAGLKGRVIEVGAGFGLNFNHYPQTVTQVVAVEPEPHLRGLAVEAAVGAPVPIEVRDATAEALPARDGEFDAAVVSLVLCSVADQQAALREIARVLRPDGELRFYEHVVSHRPASARVQRAMDATVYPWLAGGCHCARDTGAAIRRAGFRIQREERFAFKGARLTPAIPHILGSARRP